MEKCCAFLLLLGLSLTQANPVKPGQYDDGKYRPEANYNKGFVGQAGAVKGVPGVDFPDYTTLPVTNFKCSDQSYSGLYADIEARCQVYHSCHDGRKNSFMCVTGTVFNQQTSTCDYWYSVECDQSENYYYLNGFIGISDHTKGGYTQRPGLQVGSPVRVPGGPVPVRATPPGPVGPALLPRPIPQAKRPLPPLQPLPPIINVGPKPPVVPHVQRPVIIPPFEQTKIEVPVTDIYVPPKERPAFETEPRPIPPPVVDIFEERPVVDIVRKPFPPAPPVAPRPFKPAERPRPPHREFHKPDDHPGIFNVQRPPVIEQRPFPPPEDEDYPGPGPEEPQVILDNRPIPGPINEEVIINEPDPVVIEIPQRPAFVPSKTNFKKPGPLRPFVDIPRQDYEVKKPFVPQPIPELVRPSFVPKFPEPEIFPEVVSEVGPVGPPEPVPVQPIIVEEVIEEDQRPVPIHDHRPLPPKTGSGPIVFPESPNPDVQDGGKTIFVQGGGDGYVKGGNEGSKFGGFGFVQGGNDGSKVGFVSGHGDGSKTGFGFVQGGGEGSKTGFVGGQGGTDGSKTGFISGHGGGDGSKTGFVFVQGGGDGSKTGFVAGQGGSDGSKMGFISGHGGSDGSGFVFVQGGGDGSKTGFVSGHGGSGGSKTGFGFVQGGGDGLKTGFVSGQGGTDGSKTGFVSGHGGSGGSKTGFGFVQGEGDGLKTGFVSGQGGTGGSKTGFVSGHGGSGGSKTGFGFVQGGGDGLKTGFVGTDGSKTGFVSGHGGSGGSKTGFGFVQGGGDGLKTGFVSGHGGNDGSKTGFISGHGGSGGSGFVFVQGGGDGSKTGFVSGHGGTGGSKAGFGFVQSGGDGAKSGFISGHGGSGHGSKTGFIFTQGGAGDGSNFGYIQGGRPGSKSNFEFSQGGYDNTKTGTGYVHHPTKQPVIVQEVQTLDNIPFTPKTTGISKTELFDGIKTVDKVPKSDYIPVQPVILHTEEPQIFHEYKTDSPKNIVIESFATQHPEGPIHENITPIDVIAEIIHDEGPSAVIHDIEVDARKNRPIEVTFVEHHKPEIVVTPPKTVITQVKTTIFGGQTAGKSDQKPQIFTEGKTQTQQGGVVITEGLKPQISIEHGGTQGNNGGYVKSVYKQTFQGSSQQQQQQQQFSSFAVHGPQTCTSCAQDQQQDKKKGTVFRQHFPTFPQQQQQQQQGFGEFPEFNQQHGFRSLPQQFTMTRQHQQQQQQQFHSSQFRQFQFQGPVEESSWSFSSGPSEERNIRMMVGGGHGD